MAESLNISDIRLYNLLKSKYGEKDAEGSVSLIKDEVHSNFEAKKDLLATKEDLHALELKLTQEISKVRVEVAQTKASLILWAFVFWVTQLGAIFAFLKFIPH